MKILKLTGSAVFLFLVGFASIVILFDARNKIQNRVSSLGYSENLPASELAAKVTKGGLILFFRHAEREKWIDVAMYDAIEANHQPLAENRYFKDAVCLSSRGLVQGRAMGDVIKTLTFPVKTVVTSPSCRARQTAELAFGGYDKIDHTFMHRGPYLEDEEELIQAIREQILQLETSPDKNVIISAHNGVIKPGIFDKLNIKFDDDLEEGGFYVMENRNGSLILIGYFNNFQFFHKEFERRQAGS